MPTAEELEAIRQRIKESKRARNSSGNSTGYNLRILRAIVPQMTPGTAHPITDLEVWLEVAGIKYSCVGPATTFGIREGYLKRTGKGVYQVGDKPLPEVAA